MVKNSIFGSKSEKEGYRSIKNNLGNSYNIFPNLRVWDIIDIDTLPILDWEKEYLKKSHFDYTICENGEKPVLSIEFDGLGKGFNLYDKYIPTIENVDEKRKKYMGIKLKICKLERYPLIIISYDEINKKILDNSQLCIVDGIIGDILSSQNLRKNISKFEDLIDEKYGNNQIDDEAIQDEFTAFEMEHEMSYNPVCFYAAELKLTLFQSKLKNHHIIYKFVDSLDTPEEMNVERINHLNNAKKVGFEIVYKNGNYSKKRTVWINNIVSEYYSPYGIIQEIAEIILFQELFLEFNIPFKHWSELRQNWGKSIN